MTTSIKTVFFGTSDRTEPILEDLSQNTELTLCVTKAPVRVGRHQEIKETKVAEWAQKKGINTFKIHNMKQDEAGLISVVKQAKPDVIIVADFGFILKEAVLETFGDKLINIHFSLLPRWRGASPVQATILAGDTVTGITFMKMENAMDTGDILFQKKVPVSPEVTAGDLYEELFKEAGTLVSQVVKEYVASKLKPIKQDETRATYTYSKTHPNSTFVFKEDARINWKESAEQILRGIRAYNPWPIAWTTLGELEDTTKLAESTKLKEKWNGSPKTLKIYEARQAGNGKILPLTVQVEGKRKTTWQEFLNGYCKN